MSIHETITQQIADAIERGAGEFIMPWHCQNYRPRNLVSKKAYRGANTLALWATATERGYTSGTWATYKQWAEIGAQVRKGEKATHIAFYKTLDRKTDAQSETDGESSETRNSFLMAKAYFVFNACQVDGYAAEPATASAANPVAAIAAADQFIGQLGAIVTHNEAAAYYRRDTDTINMPPKTVFTGTLTSTATESYYSTLLHELTHWTGAPHRLNREKGKRFGDSVYAFEELIAELGAAFACADLGITSAPRVDHAQYIAHWLAALKSDSRAIFKAASAAQSALDWMHAKQSPVAIAA